MQLGNNKDKFGFYKVGTIKTYSKVEAIEISQRTGHFPQWIFNDLEFSAYDWRIEPQDSLRQLYAARAQQIREHYDHVVLFYSGGADSSNMLDAFVENSVPFDEIVTVNYRAVDPDPASYFNAEQLQVSYPRIKQLQDQGVRFRHRPIDLSDITKQVLCDDTYRLTRAYWSNTHWGTNHFSKSFIREKNKDYQKLIDQGKKIVFVWGCDKPRLFKQEGRYCVKFLDIVDTCVPTRTQIVNRDWEYDEFFYWAPECADIVCKQAHVLMNFLRRYNISLDRDYRDDEPLNLPDINNIFSERHTAVTHRNLINLLIYPNFDCKTFSSGKIPSVVNNPNDKVFLQDPNWRTHIDRLCDHLKQIDHRWHNDITNIDRGLVCNVSPSYYLE